MTGVLKKFGLNHKLSYPSPIVMSLNSGKNNQIDQQGVLEMPHSIAKFESRSEKLELMREHHCNTIEESDFLIEETTQMQAQKVFDEMLNSEMKVLCVTATVEMKTDIGDEVYEGSILQKQKVSGEINDKLDETKIAKLVRRLNPGEALKSASNFDALQRFALSFNSVQRVTCAQYLHICANENHFNRFFHDHAHVQWREEPPAHSKYLCAAYYSKPLNLNTLLSLFSEYDSPRSVSCSIQIIFGKLMHTHMETSRRFVTMCVGSAMGESYLRLLNINGVAMVETDLKIGDQINGGPIFPKSIICDGMVGLGTKFWEIAQKVQKGKFSNWVRWMKPIEDGGSAYAIEFIPSSFLDEAYQRRLSAHLYVVRVLWRVNDVTVLHYFKLKGMTTTSLAYQSEMKNNEIDLVFYPGGLETFKVEHKWGNDICSKYFPCIFYKPVGVVGAITPCNFLLAMITPKIVHVLASGCTVIKSSRLTPLTALAAAELAIQARIPCGELNEVVGNASGIGDVLLRSPQKVSLELGGNALYIIFDDAYLDVAMNGTPKTKFRNSGQTGVCADRLVQEAIHRANDTNVEVVRKEKRIDGGGSTLNFSKHVWVGVSVAMVSRTILAPLEGLKLDCIVRSEQMKQQGDEFNAFEPLKLNLVRTLIYGAIVGATYSFQVFTRQFQIQSQALQMGTSKISWKIVEQGDIQALYVGHNTSSLQVLPSAGVLWNLATFEEV